jgi:hypothetical protein
LVASSAAPYAERCINLAPDGPYAAECRKLLAAAAGLDEKAGAALKTQAEIEDLISSAAQTANPAALSALFPLIALPDNPYTLYASGAMRSLAANGRFKEWFSGEAVKAKGRLAERLRYITRG